MNTNKLIVSFWIVLKHYFSFLLISLNSAFLTDLFLILFFILIVFIFFLFLFKYLPVRSQLKINYVLLELQPPIVTQQSVYSTQQLLVSIHGLAGDKNKSYGLEIVSTKDEGIRYLIRVKDKDADVIKKSLLSYLPGLKIKEVSDYFTEGRITQFKLKNHFTFPLKNQQSLEEFDPIAYITGNMTKLNAYELVAFQLIISPLLKSKVGDIKTVSNLIYQGKDLPTNLQQMGLKSWPLRILKFILFVILQLLFLPIGILIFIFTGSKEGPLLKLDFNYSKDKTNNAYQQELEKIIKNKLDQPLFNTSIRLLIFSKNKERIKKIEKGFAASLTSFDNSGYQRLFIKKSFKCFENFLLFFFKHRLINLFSNSILSVSEVSDIYHFPFTLTTKTENILKTHSQELPAPLSLKKTTDLDIYFAKNTYGGTTTKIGLSLEERRRHMYILGATGTGKSTLLLSMIREDIKNGKGLAIIDPHGDLIEKILNIIPENRINDVIYFNPDDIAYPIAINLLELTPGLSENETLREKEFVTESIISFFRKLFSEKYSGPRMEYILRNTIYTAFTVPNCTLFTVYKLLSNTPYQKSITNFLDDENLSDFWKYEFGKAGDYQIVSMISPITNKIGRFLFSPTAKRILEQPKSSINFDDIMDSGKILLCNLSKGKLGEDASEMFGVLLMTKIQLAALKRARIEDKDRKDFYLYVDEFQNFATPSFAQILSEARKYRLNAILAHQTTSQLEDKSLINITLANTGTIICFRTANPEDERLLLPQFYPYVDKGEIASLPSFHFYIKINALTSEEPFSGETVLISFSFDKDKVKKVIEASRANYAIVYKKNQIKIITKQSKIIKKQEIIQEALLP